MSKPKFRGIDEFAPDWVAIDASATGTARGISMTDEKQTTEWQGTFIAELVRLGANLSWAEASAPNAWAECSAVIEPAQAAREEWEDLSDRRSCAIRAQ